MTSGSAAARLAQARRPTVVPSLSGADNAYSNLSHVIRNLCLLEATFGQLYLVLLIGRVLLPDESPPKAEG